METFTEENLSNIYETEVRIIPHPDSGAPQAMFVPGGQSTKVSAQ